MRNQRSSRREFLVQGASAAAGLALVGSGGVRAAAIQAQATSAKATELAAKGAAFLRGRQEENGGWSTSLREPGISALVIAGLLKSKQATAAEPLITKGLGYLEQFVGPEGGLEGAHANYSTCIALMAFHEANAEGRFDVTIKSAQNFLKKIQWDESEDKRPEDPYYGGVGYGSRQSRPDLSNTAFMVEALRETGLPADDPALQKALIFVSRCQDFKSEFNDRPWPQMKNDGGFIYVPPSGEPEGERKKGRPDRLSSYGSMTYAGFKSLVYAGLGKDDPRVKAALGYIGDNYTLEENPGVGQSGLYYYYHIFAKAMNALGEPEFADAQGKRHNWAADLTAALAKRQDANGSWANPADRFMEGDANLVTAFALIALAQTLPSKPKPAA